MQTVAILDQKILKISFFFFSALLFSVSLINIHWCSTKQWLSNNGKFIESIYLKAIKFSKKCSKIIIQFSIVFTIVQFIFSSYWIYGVNRKSELWILLKFLENYVSSELHKNFIYFLFLIIAGTSPSNQSVTVCIPNLKYPIKFKLTSYWLLSFFQSTICLDILDIFFNTQMAWTFLFIFKNTCDRVLSNKRKYTTSYFKMEYEFAQKLRFLAVLLVIYFKNIR